MHQQGTLVNKIGNFNNSLKVLLNAVLILLNKFGGQIVKRIETLHPRDYSRHRRARAIRCVLERIPPAGCARGAVGRACPLTAPVSERADRTLPTLKLNLLIACSSHRATKTWLFSGWDACRTHHSKDSARMSRPRDSRLFPIG